MIVMSAYLATGKMEKQRRKLLSVFILSVSLSGCAIQPSVDGFVTSIRPMPSTLFEQRAEIQLRLRNLSESTLTASGIDVQMLVNGKRLARGVKAENIAVDPLSERLVSVTVSTRAIDIFRQVLGIQDREMYSYRLKGRLVTSGLDKRFEHGGEISRAELLRLFQPQ